jgi:hypothetical protein
MAADAAKRLDIARERMMRSFMVQALLWLMGANVGTAGLGG